MNHLQGEIEFRLVLSEVSGVHQSNTHDTHKEIEKHDPSYREKKAIETATKSPRY